MSSLVIGTAGHIDHGKSALVKALTGTDPDRLKEEQARGITIDLGFAHTRLGDLTVAFVDVPGHERFVKNMLAGAGGIDAVLLVVAADESVMPQTREHFEICRLLGLERGVIALTKSDAADQDMQALAALEVRELVAGSFLAAAPIVSVSARTGAGLDDLRAALASLAGISARHHRTGVVRLAIDRAFSMKGFGPVVTGTLVSGAIAIGDELTLLPAGVALRVRGLQVHGRTVGEVGTPSRVAVNVGGIEAADVARGMTLATAGSVAVTNRVDVRIEMLRAARPLRHGARIRVHHGTSELMARVSVSATRQHAGAAWRQAQPGDAAVAVPSGGEAFVRIRLGERAVLTRGDRVILRTYSPPVTIGGGTVLDPEPPSGGVRRLATLERFRELDSDVDVAAGLQPRGPHGGLKPAAYVEQFLTQAGTRGIDAAMLVRRGGLAPDAARGVLDALSASGRGIAIDGRVYDARAIARLRSDVIASLTAFHRGQPLDDGLARAALRDEVASDAPVSVFDYVIDALERAGDVRGADRLALASHRPTLTGDEARARSSVEQILRDAGLTPPDVTGLAESTGVPRVSIERAVQMLVRDRALVRIGTLYFHADALAGLKRDLQELARRAPAHQPAQVDVATFKSRYGLSRKYAIPLLEWLDGERVTRRKGETRVLL